MSLTLRTASTLVFLFFCLHFLLVRYKGYFLQSHSLPFYISNCPNKSSKSSIPLQRPYRDHTFHVPADKSFDSVVICLRLHVRCLCPINRPALFLWVWVILMFLFKMVSSALLPTPNLNDWGIPFSLRYHLWPVKHGRLYKQLRYCQHRSQDYLTTQALSPSMRVVGLVYANREW
jgi:hypothetical protein